MRELGGQGVRGSGDAPGIMNIKAISADSILGQFWNGMLFGARAGGEDAPTGDLQLIVLVPARQIRRYPNPYLLAEWLVRTLLWTVLDAWWEFAIYEPRQLASLVATWQWRFVDPAPRIYYNTI